MTALDPVFLKTPIAHRALHGEGRPENSRAAVRAAVAAGYGIEIDLQPSADGEAMVFHDYDLRRLTGETGVIRTRDAAELGRIALSGGDGEGIPTLREILAIVGGRVPLLVELKDQHGRMGPTDGALEAAAARALAGYAGPLAVMSFNGHAVARMGALRPDIPRGLTTSAFDEALWPHMPEELRARLREAPEFERSGAMFISHEHTDLDRPRVVDIRATGVPVLSWTIRSEAEERAARRLAQNVTFEGYRAAVPA
ncbi:glycerophosphodiester phosphodiesterase family protein [Rhodosalinus sp. 5P4]|uniref:glycerophosphodiester phosphodiesterase family protein n=1 Tax=Rhodosalinus sp. 5P4 TaxID=3239196 RepID=UPI003523E030